MRCATNIAAGRWTCQAMVAVNGMTQRADLESQLQDLQATLPEQCVLVGWSLGGQLALELARRAPQQVRALVLIASTPRFTQAADWPQGMDAETVRAFGTLLAQDWRQTLRDFVQLQVRGGRNAEAHAAATGSSARSAWPAARCGAARGAGPAHWSGSAHGAGAHTAARAGDCPARTTASLRRQRDAGWPMRLPNARHVEIARAGHAPLLSHVDEVAVGRSGSSCDG